MDKITLTATQEFVLSHAVAQPEGRIVAFPEGVRGGAQKKVLKGLFDRALITTDGTDWFVAAEGYDALGVARPGASRDDVPEPDDLDAAPAEEAPPVASDPEVERDVAAAESAFAKPARAPRTREGSKQAQVVAMLKRPEGATIAQICAATQWQAHTVRGIFAGALKKKLGLTITSEKAAGGERVYRAS